MIIWSRTTDNCVVIPFIGVGDFSVADVSFLPDPCPLPEAIKKRALNVKERLLYAPMAGVGGLVYDKDAVYIDMPRGHASQQQVRFQSLHITYSRFNSGRNNFCSLQGSHSLLHQVITLFTLNFVPSVNMTLRFKDDLWSDGY